VGKKTLKNKSKENIKAQRKRRQERSANRPQRQSEAFELIDGNYSHYPVGYCNRKGAYLTQGLIDTHQCYKKACKRLVAINES
jgi:hypothetical protein